MAVYLVSNGKHTKIGTSVNPRHRIATLQTASPETLLPMAVFHGGEELEQLLHKHFAPFHVRGEWFQLSNEHVKEAEQIAERYLTEQRQQHALKQDLPVVVGSQDYDDAECLECTVYFLPCHGILRAACREERVRRLLLFAAIVKILAHERRVGYLQEAHDELRARFHDVDVTVLSPLTVDPSEVLLETGNVWYSHKAMVAVVRQSEERLRALTWTRSAHVQDGDR